MLKRIAPFVVAPLLPAAVLLLTFLGLSDIGIGGGLSNAVWLFSVFGVVFGLAGLLLAWTFVGWSHQAETETPPRERRSPFRRI